jgi:hypothetical protein
VFVIPTSETIKLHRLYEKYGVELEKSPAGPELPSDGLLNG